MTLYRITRGPRAGMTGVMYAIYRDGGRRFCLTSTGQMVTVQRDMLEPVEGGQAVTVEMTRELREGGTA